MKRLLFVLVCIVALSFTSCAGYNNTIHNSVNQTEVILQKNSYKVVKNVSGSTEQVYIFGIGGLREDVMRENAVCEMFKNADIKDGQAVVNITYTSAVRTLFGVYTEKRVTAYGTVIQFVD